MVLFFGEFLSHGTAPGRGRIAGKKTNVNGGAITLGNHWVVLVRAGDSQIGEKST